MTIIDYVKVNLLTFNTPDGSFSFRSHINRMTSSNTSICLCQKKKGISLDFYQSFPRLNIYLMYFNHLNNTSKAGPYAKYLSRQKYIKYWMLGPDQLWWNRLWAYTVKLLFEQVFVSGGLRASAQMVSNDRTLVIWLHGKLFLCKIKSPAEKEESYFARQKIKITNLRTTRTIFLHFTESQFRCGSLPISEVPNFRKISNILNTSGHSLGFEYLGYF